MSFIQSPPKLGNQFTEDRVLRSFLQRHLPPDLLHGCEAELETMGQTTLELRDQQLQERTLEPLLTQWDAWGNRIDEISLTPLWQQARDIAAKSGLVATAYEGNYQPYGRLVQMALVYLFHPSTDMFCCPLAMTDGATRILLDSGNKDLIHRAVGHLTSRDPARFWTSGQWMTERIGGSDVGETETIARQTAAGWILDGTKWFTSAATSEMALTLARPEGNPPGGAGLALFYLEPWGDQQQPNKPKILRLKDKLGTRKLPTAELVLEQTPAELVGSSKEGVKAISPMLNITRTWNAVCAVSFMRRALALARSYARQRRAFGAPLIELPLHSLTLAKLQAEFEASFHLTFFVVRELGLNEHNQLSTERQVLLRLLIPIAKILTGKQAVEIASEALECFGGAGYVEETGVSVILRDAQVLPIWEGTTNVLSLDVLRVVRDPHAQRVWSKSLRRWLKRIDTHQLSADVETVQTAIKQVKRWFGRAADQDLHYWQFHARALAMSIGRISAATLLLDQAHHDTNARSDALAGLAARQFIANDLVLLASRDRGDEIETAMSLSSERS